VQQRVAILRKRFPGLSLSKNLLQERLPWHVPCGLLSSYQRWLNGLLFSGLDDGFFIDLDKREKGYNRIGVDPSCLHEYGSSDAITGRQNIYIYTGQLDKHNDSILPNTSYLDTCLEGAKQWGEDFYSDFLDSTFVKNNILLRE
jgi:hypothetical protein